MIVLAAGLSARIAGAEILIGVLGPIGFDAKGDVTLQSPVVYVWHADGSRMLEPGAAKE